MISKKEEVLFLKLKKDLVLRKIVGQNIVVPIGRLAKISPMMEITESAAWLWNQMKDQEFDEDSLVDAVMGHFSGVTEQQARKDVQSFLDLLDKNYMLENGRPEPMIGSAEVQLTPEQAKKFNKE